MICILSYSIVKAQNEPVGIKATIRGDGPKLVLTYNKNTQAMKIESDNNNKPNYMDRNGWLYMEDNDDPTGWKKMNLGGMMGMSTGDLMGPNTNFSPLQDVIQNNIVPLTVSEGVLDAYEDSETAANETITVEEVLNDENNANFFLPMIEWGMRFKVRHFENSKFRFQLVNCDEPVPCRRFEGITEEVQGVAATFNPDGRVQKIEFQEQTISYKYGNYTVNLPNATEFKIPVKFGADLIPDPDN